MKLPHEGSKNFSTAPKDEAFAESTFNRGSPEWPPSSVLRGGVMKFPAGKENGDFKKNCECFEFQRLCRALSQEWACTLNTSFKTLLGSADDDVTSGSAALDKCHCNEGFCGITKVWACLEHRKDMENRERFSKSHNAGVTCPHSFRRIQVRCKH
jgi:hypothetical protein